MATTNLTAVLEGAARIKNTWASNPTFALGEITFEKFNTVYDTVTELETTIETKRHELQGLLDQRDDQAKALAQLNTRALSGIRAVFGPDSPQYDQAGGIRASERATGKRGAKAAKA